MKPSEAECAVKGPRGKRQEQRSDASLIPASERGLMMIYRPRKGDSDFEDISNDLAALKGEPQHDRGKLLKLAEKQDIGVRAVTVSGVERAETGAGWVVGDGSQKFAPGLVYAKHPIDDNVYLPLAQYAEEIYREKHEAVVRMLIALGARKVYANGRTSARGKATVPIACWTARSNGQGEVETNIPWFRALEAEASRFRRRGSFAEEDHRWISYDPKIAEIASAVQAGGRKPPLGSIHIEAKPPLDQTQLDLMKKWKINIGKPSNYPTHVTLSATF